MSRFLSPLKINLLLHIHAFAEPFAHPDAPAYRQAKQEFVRLMLIAEDSDPPCGYKLLPRGEALIRMLLATPVPTESLGWIDPRTGESV